MAFDLNLGSITNIMGDFFSMSLQNGSTKEVLPCTIIELSENDTETIPQTPQDTNSYIADTIFKQPLQVTLQVFVYTRNFDAFEVAMKQAQLSEKGFIINGVYKSYTNMRRLDKSFTESASRVGGVMYNITFEEAILVQSFNEAMSVEQVKKLQDSAKVESGTKTPQKSALKQGLEFFGVM